MSGIGSTLDGAYSKSEDDEGNEFFLTRILCETCDNEFYVVKMPENMPSYCCYCGATFTNWKKQGESHEGTTDIQDT